MRKVFFSFHYSRDAWSVGQIRNSWIGNPQHEAQPILDRAQWETIKRQGNAAITAWIERQMNGTSVTVVLIGPQTLSRPWVRYEIDKSQRNAKGLMGITMENMVQRDQRADVWDRYATYGPFNDTLQSAPVYSWIANSGRQNLGKWVEDAARAVGS